MLHDLSLVLCFVYMSYAAFTLSSLSINIFFAFFTLLCCQFKEIQFAYEVLADAQRRELYDRFGLEAVKEGGGGSGGFPADGT